jgi:hypothetical protein
VALIVVAPDMPKIDSRGDALDPEQGAHIVRKARIVGNPPEPVQCLEQRADGLLIGFLRRCKTGAVDAVV